MNCVLCGFTKGHAEWCDRNPAKGQTFEYQLARVASAIPVPPGFGQNVDGSPGMRVGTNIASIEEWRQFFVTLIAQGILGPSAAPSNDFDVAPMHGMPHCICGRVLVCFATDVPSRAAPLLSWQCPEHGPAFACGEYMGGMKICVLPKHHGGDHDSVVVVTSASNFAATDQTLPKPAGPNIVRVLESTDAEDVNVCLAGGATLLGAAVDPYGQSHYALGFCTPPNSRMDVTLDMIAAARTAFEEVHPGDDDRNGEQLYRRVLTAGLNAAAKT